GPPLAGLYHVGQPTRDTPPLSARERASHHLARDQKSHPRPRPEPPPRHHQEVDLDERDHEQEQEQHAPEPCHTGGRSPRRDRARAPSPGQPDTISIGSERRQEPATTTRSRPVSLAR